MDRGVGVRVTRAIERRNGPPPCRKSDEPRTIPLWDEGQPFVSTRDLTSGDFLGTLPAERTVYSERRERNPLNSATTFPLIGLQLPTASHLLTLVRLRYSSVYITAMEKERRD